MRSHAYVLARDNKPPDLPKDGKWWVMEIGLGLLGKFNRKDWSKVPKVVVPRFTLVATNRKAAKAEVARKIDELFDCFEEGAGK